jgi:hypothetical protein
MLTSGWLASGCYIQLAQVAMQCPCSPAVLLAVLADQVGLGQVCPCAVSKDYLVKCATCCAVQVGTLRSCNGRS